MEPLLLHPTATALWQTIVVEAEDSLSFHLNEELESYLVFLLMRFAKNADLMQSVVAIDLLSSMKQLARERDQALQEVGDKCLLFSGLFPGQARRCRVRISYFVQLGQYAYESLAKLPLSKDPVLFSSLCHHFVALMDILHTIRDSKHNKPFLDLLQAEELWQDTRSLHALKMLKSNIQGFNLAEYHPIPNGKQ